RAASARPALPHLRRVRRLLPAGVGGAGGSERGRGGTMTDPRPGNEAPARHDRALRVLLPIAVLALVVVVWEAAVRVAHIPPSVPPSPQVIFSTLVADWGMLSAALLVTLATTIEGFLLAAVGGVALAVLFNQSRVIEYSLYPYAVILQVTPIVAIAPLLL